MADGRDVLITGIGLVSSLGEGLDAHWAALDRPDGVHPVVDAERFAPFTVHPMTRLEFDRQIPKKGDQRQMEAWQRIGTYAAGLALEQAGLKGNVGLLERTDMIVAAGGGERDYGVDTAILSALPHAERPEVLLNERLMADLRPTLFLAQLSNLLAGNISVVHGVVGSSRTFMGEEAAGIDAVRIACARIAAGQGDVILVGGSFNAERPDLLLEFALGRMLLQDEYDPVWARQAKGGGIVLGSVGCFLVLESRDHAASRGARPLSRIVAVASDGGRRTHGSARTTAVRQLAAMRPLLATEGVACISGASGAPEPTREEQAFLAETGFPVRAAGTALGHGLEPTFPACIALATAALSQGRLFPPLEATEAPMSGMLRQVVISCWGHWRGEGLALVEAV